MKSIRDLCDLNGEGLVQLHIKPSDISPSGAFTGFLGIKKQGKREGGE